MVEVGKGVGGSGTTVGLAVAPGLVGATLVIVGATVDAVGLIVSPGTVGETVLAVGEGVAMVGLVVSPGIVGDAVSARISVGPNVTSLAVIVVVGIDELVGPVTPVIDVSVLSGHHLTFMVSIFVVGKIVK